MVYWELLQTKECFRARNVEGVPEKRSTPLAWEWELKFLMWQKDKTVAFENDSKQVYDA